MAVRFVIVESEGSGMEALAWQRVILFGSTLIVWSMEWFLFELTRAAYFPFGNQPQRLLGGGEVIAVWIWMSLVFLAYCTWLGVFLSRSQFRRTDYIRFGFFVGAIVIAQLLMIFFPWWPVC